MRFCDAEGYSCWPNLWNARALFLPLLPVLGFWIASSEVDFSMLLFIVGGLYGLLSILRRSFAFGLLAAVAGNGGLWYMFQRTADYGFFQHPQLWLVPAALSVLAASYLNKDKLSEDQTDGRAIPVAGHDLHLVNRGHLHQRRREFTVATVDTRIVLTRRHLRRHRVSHSRHDAARIGISVAVDRDDDLVCVGQLRLDVAVVRLRHRDRRHDHFHVRGLRKETQHKEAAEFERINADLISVHWRVNPRAVCALFRGQLAAGVEIVPVQDRVEDEEVAALRLPAPERIRREQQHVTIAGRHIDDCRSLRDLIATVQQSRNKQVAAVGITQHHARTLVRRYQTNRVA